MTRVIPAKGRAGMLLELPALLLGGFVGWCSGHSCDDSAVIDALDKAIDSTCAEARAMAEGLVRIDDIASVDAPKTQSS